ncbi:hypothetical protein [Viridibacillus arvi]|uniref:hypothetical protein n=1 Tax=Viridibacillus arvi TaxID=263475 RepID=UPI0034CF95ED
MFKKLLLGSTALTLGLSILAPFGGKAHANEVDVTTTPLTVVNSTEDISFTDTEVNENSIQPFGVKKWIAVQALKATSKALRSGGSLVTKITKELGGSEGKTFAKHTDTIADALDDLVRRGDVVEDAVIDTVSTALISAGVKSSTARSIAAVFTFFAF